MRNSLVKNNAGIDGISNKLRPGEEKNTRFRGCRKGRAVRLGVDIGGDDEHARDEKCERERKLIGKGFDWFKSKLSTCQQCVKAWRVARGKPGHAHWHVPLPPRAVFRSECRQDLSKL
jgi:hypothetical protein